MQGRRISYGLGASIEVSFSKRHSITPITKKASIGHGSKFGEEAFANLR